VTAWENFHEAVKADSLFFDSPLHVDQAEKPLLDGVLKSGQMQGTFQVQGTRRKGKTTKNLETSTLKTLYRVP
jgi:hypothetical protein